MAILSRIRGEKDIAIAVAFSGIAALLLAGGQTLHSKLKLPFEVQIDSMLNIRNEDAMAEVIRKAKIIIWDEAPMAHKNILEAIDRSFKDIMQCDEPFGGKTLVLAGDFRQVLPVIPHAGRRDVVEAALNQSSLWKHIAVFHLKTNERIKRMKKLHPNINAAKLKKFADDLEKIGDGTYPTHEELGENVIRIPDHWLSKSETIDEFIHEIFPAQGFFLGHLGNMSLS